MKHKIPRVGLRAEESARFAPTARDDDVVLVQHKLLSPYTSCLSRSGRGRAHIRAEEISF
jgi:hypothetical protein